MAFITYEPAQCMQEPAMPYTNIEGASCVSLCFYTYWSIMNATSCVHCLGRMITIYSAKNLKFLAGLCSWADMFWPTQNTFSWNMGHNVIFFASVATANFKTLSCWSRKYPLLKKQWGSWSAGFWWSQLIRICTAFHAVHDFMDRLENRQECDIY